MTTADQDPRPLDAWDAIRKLDVLDRQLEGLARDVAALRLLEMRLRGERRDAEGLALLYLGDARPGTAIRAGNVEYLLHDDGVARWLAPLVTLDALSLELPAPAAEDLDTIGVEVPVTIGRAIPAPPAFVPLPGAEAGDVIDLDFTLAEAAAGFELPAEGPTTGQYDALPAVELIDAGTA